MLSSLPRVSLGLPVFNGEPFLRHAIESMLAQTFTDFELIICDNASTDRSWAIAQEYANRDPRICCFRNERNVGPAENFNRAFRLAQGPYFKWVAADDLCEPDWLRRCVEALDANRSAALAYTRTNIIDDEGKLIRRDRYFLNTDSASVSQRYRALTMVDHHRHGAFEIFGLFRSDVLRKTSLFPPICRGDSLLLIEAALRGPFIRIDEELFLNRDHGRRSVRVPPSRVAAGSFFARFIGAGPTPPAEWWDERMRGRLVFPEWKLAWSDLVALFAAPLNLWQRCACVLCWCWFVVRNSPKLLRDLLFALERPFFLLRPRRRPLRHPITRRSQPATAAVPSVAHSDAKTESARAWPDSA